MVAAVEQVRPHSTEYASGSAYTGAGADTLMRGWRILFYGLTVCAGLLFWLAPHPPMTDLPQHAGQVSLALAILKGESPWSELFRINYFTPYLVGYGFAGIAALVFPVAVAMKICLTLAFYGFVFVGLLLRRALGSDERLDWLLIPGFFGFAFKWGMFTFLVAAPFGLLFMLLAKTYSDRSTGLRAALVFFCGLLLFFCHGLIFLMAVGIGAMFVLLHPSSPRVQRLTRLVPYGALVPIVVGYYLYAMRIEEPVAAGLSTVQWRLGPQRLAQMLFDIWGTVDDWPFALAGLIAFAVPWLLGSRFQKDRRAFIPFALLFVAWMTMPVTALKTAFLYPRFALFVLPFYSLMFSEPSPDGKSSATRGFAQSAAIIAMPAICFFFLAIVASRMLGFARESADFDALAARAEPSRRALSLVFDRESPAANNSFVYLHYPLWYQTERGGLVEFNFAAFLPQPVRYKPQVFIASERVALAPRTFDWVADRGALYDYFFVRGPVAPPKDFLANAQCAVRLTDSVGKWYLYERLSCH